MSCFVLAQNSTTYLFAGSYTEGEQAEGIYVYAFNEETGELTEVERKPNLVNPSFITLSPNGKYLYACTETKLEQYGSVSAFKIDTLTGGLTFLNKQNTGGRNPVHLVVDQTNKFVLASNYTDAGIAVFECNADGSIQPFSQLIEFEGKNIIEGRQDGAHIHSCNFSLDYKYVFAPDLGADKIRVFAFDEVGLLIPIDNMTIETEKGSGPRHFTFHPNQSFAYCVEELSGSVSLYTLLNGQLHWVDDYQSYKHKEDEYASADVHISPDGKFLYSSNRQDDHSITVFSINQSSGELTLRNHQSTFGTIPRSFVIDPSGNYLIVANQTSNELIVFKRNLETGMLTKGHVISGIESPSSIKMIKYGNHGKTE